MRDSYPRGLPVVVSIASPQRLGDVIPARELEVRRVLIRIVIAVVRYEKPLREGTEWEPDDHRSV